MINNEFQALAAEAQAAINENPPEVKWTPPGSLAGTSYNVHLLEVNAGVFTDKKTQAQVPNVSLKFRVMDGEFSDRTFKLSFNTNRTWDMGMLFSAATAITGDASFMQDHDFLEAVRALDAVAGNSYWDITGKDRTSKTNRTFTNWTFNQILEVG